MVLNALVTLLTSYLECVIRSRLINSLHQEGTQTDVFKNSKCLKASYLYFEWNLILIVSMQSKCSMSAYVCTSRRILYHVCTMHVCISFNEHTKQSSIAVTVFHALVSTYHKTNTIYDSAPCTTEVQTDATQVCYSATCPHTMPYIDSVWYTLTLGSCAVVMCLLISSTISRHLVSSAICTGVFPL